MNIQARFLFRVQSQRERERERESKEEQGEKRGGVKS